MAAVEHLDLDEQIARWRAHAERRQAIGTDVDELEDHLRGLVEELEASGLSPDEAFLVAVRRMGALDDVSREFAREHAERLWKQLVVMQDDGPPGRGRRGLGLVLALAVGAGLAVKIPSLFDVDGDTLALFYLPNLSLLVFPFLAAWFAWSRSMPARRVWVQLVLPFAVAALAANLFPLTQDSASLVLMTIHLPIALWFVVGLAYTGGEWRSGARRMDFIRFTGEWFVYYVLIALGGAALVGLTGLGFTAIGVDPFPVLGAWVVPCGAAGAVLVAAWLVEAKQNVIENIAPVLTRVFTPLTTIALLVFLVTVAVARPGVDVERELLILGDLMLVLVLGLILYALSARSPDTPPGLFDRLQLLLVALALVVDALMLVAMAGRIAEFGASPNKVAALGLNIVLLVNLARAGWLGLGFVRGRRPFGAVERWQTDYLPVIAVWVTLVALVLPPVFGWA
ncbi:permease prefix domain 1-containing protein [Paraoerskovia marina]|uniref:permease prefix domain 1-containing protein n=1 Tax=Paraoerskovia marina TaxID=545619 RepID=UPI000492A1DD|nr:permease prefix domain 1-containing protein [Paraoerskovia marina]